jgi:ATP-dependent helicase/nuclease subunit B
MSGKLRLYTIAPDGSFLDVLSRTMLSGFPKGGPGPADPAKLHEWTVLLPTRRSVRALQDIFFRDIDRKAALLPRIHPIGDIDEDRADFPFDGLELPQAISATGRLFALMSIIGDWAKGNPHMRLAAEINAAPQQRHALALSLGALLDGLETEECSALTIGNAYDLDLAGHRESIISLFDLIAIEFPAHLEKENRIGHAARRNRLIRVEAERIALSLHEGPIVAAGSTGTNPATRELLRAIAANRRGAVILPGLDKTIDDASWTAISPQHPQYALKQLLLHLGVTREDVIELLPAPSMRVWLGGEIMRPTDVADAWKSTLTGKSDHIRAAVEGLHLAACDSREHEALTIALILRESLEHDGKTAVLVTPDRTLARQVKATLGRWNVTVDDSAGEPLSRTIVATLLLTLADAALAGFEPRSLARLIHHPLAFFGFNEDAERAGTFEAAIMRQSPQPESFADCMAIVSAPPPEHAHPCARRLDDEQRARLRRFAETLQTVLSPLMNRQGAPLAEHLDILQRVAKDIAGEAFAQQGGSQDLLAAILELRSESNRLGFCSFAEAVQFLRHHLQTIPYRKAVPPHARVAILGLLEARLIRSDVVVLGGLNEGIWPEQPDPGPWLNRPMRDLLGLQQPERQIGQVAHDFVQALGGGSVYLTYAKRTGNEIAIPSRWLLRLEMILKSAGIDIYDTRFSKLARSLDQPAAVIPLQMPKPKPPADARPRQLSVTRIETLIKDPYAIYAERILGLKPLEDIGEAKAHAQRGSLYHAILAEFAKHYPGDLPSDALNKLITIGEQHFMQFDANPEAMSFWWPRFLRVAEWFIELERTELRPHARHIHTEIDGKLSLDVAGQRFILTGRADRIDQLKDGTGRIIDYKTGQLPSWTKVEKGLNPQLTLEAAMLARGVFGDFGNTPTSELIYVGASGGDPPGEAKAAKFDLRAISEDHLGKLHALLAAYANPDQAYLPRHKIAMDEAEQDYDHLSRFREWILSGRES